jgi:hypothetical protein
LIKLFQLDVVSEPIPTEYDVVMCTTFLHHLSRADALATLRKMLFARGASSVSTVALLDKSTRRIVDVPVEHRGFEVGDEFLLGYGMDWQGRYRNVPSIWAVMDLSVLTSDPDAFGQHAFRQIDRSAG